MGSLGKAWEGNRVQHTSKEVGIAYGSFGSLARRVALREERNQWIGTLAIPLLGDRQDACLRIDSALVFTCLRIALRISPENRPTRLQ